MIKSVPAYKGNEPYLFVSYSHKDSTEVIKDIKWMINSGYRVWYDEGIEYGRDFPEELALAICNCRQFVVCLSKNAIESEYVNREISYAIKMKKSILPILLEGTELSARLDFLLSSTQYLERYPYPWENYCEYLDKGLYKECKALHSIIQKENAANNSTDPESNQSGKNCGNIRKGVITHQDGWIYAFIHYVLLKIRTDGKEKTIIREKNNIAFTCIDVKGDWIYYADYWHIYKMRTDGTAESQICDDRCDCLNVVGDWVYYINESDYSRLYKISCDGTKKIKICEDSRVKSYCVYKDLIYLVIEVGFVKQSLFKIRTDGSMRSKLVDLFDYFSVDAEWIYYTYGGLHKMRLDGSEKTTLYSESVDRIFVVDEWIYYITTLSYSKSTIWRIRKDGSCKTAVCEAAGRVNDFCIFDNWVYINGYDHIYRIPADGSKTEKEVLV